MSSSERTKHSKTFLKEQDILSLHPYARKYLPHRSRRQGPTVSEQHPRHGRDESDDYKEHIREEEEWELEVGEEVLYENGKGDTEAARVLKVRVTRC